MKHRWRQSTQVRLMRVGWKIKKDWNERKLTFKVNYEVIKRKIIKTEKNNPKRYDRVIHASRTDCRNTFMFLKIITVHYCVMTINLFYVFIINVLCEFLWCEWSKRAKGKNNCKRWAWNEKYICISAEKPTLLYKKKTHQTVNIHMWCFSILELNLEDEEEEEVDRKSSESEKRHSLYGHSHVLNKIDSY